MFVAVYLCTHLPFMEGKRSRCPDMKQQNSNRSNSNKPKWELITHYPPRELTTHGKLR